MMRFSSNYRKPGLRRFFQLDAQLNRAMVFREGKKRPLEINAHTLTDIDV